MDRLRGGSYSIIPDQIEAGTYMAAVAAAGFQGVMLACWDRVADNRFHSHWMPLHLTPGSWIPKTKRTPEATDADAYGCVLVSHAHEGVRVTGWHQVKSDGGITDWQPLPDPPQEFCRRQDRGDKQEPVRMQ